MAQRLIVISGPTGSGKTALAESMAKKYGFEVISADSQAVYRGLDIGTAKPEPEGGIVYHCIDVAEPVEHYNVSRFVADAEAACRDAWKRGADVIMAGGSPMYIHRFLYGLSDVPRGDEDVRNRLREIENSQGKGTLYRRLKETDPEYAGRIHPNDLKRTIRALEVYEIGGRTFSSYEESGQDSPYDTVYFAINMERKRLYDRINMRVDDMLEKGWVHEIQSLLSNGVPEDAPGFASLGYADLIRYLNGELDYSDTVRSIKKKTRHFARRQLIWLRKEKGVNWLSGDRCTMEEMETKIMDKWKKIGG